MKRRSFLIGFLSVLYCVIRAAKKDRSQIQYHNSCFHKYQKQKILGWELSPLCLTYKKGKFLQSVTKILFGVCYSHLPIVIAQYLKKNRFSSFFTTRFMGPIPINLQLQEMNLSNTLKIIKGLSKAGFFFSFAVILYN